MRSIVDDPTAVIRGTVTSVNSNSTCCVFLGIRFTEDEKYVHVVQFRREADEALAARAAELDVGAVVSIAVDSTTVGTTRYAGRGLTIAE